MATTLLFWLLLCVVLGDVEVSAQSDVVLSWQVSTGDRTTTFNYTLDWFNKLYDCLCNDTTKSCNPSSGDGNVIDIFRFTYNNGTSSYRYSNIYKCSSSSSPTYVLCPRLQDKEANCSDVQRCVSYKRLISSQNISCGLEPVRVIWSSNENVTYWHNDSVLMITSCKPGCDQLQNSSSTPEPQVSRSSLVSSSLIPVTSPVSSLQMSTTSSVSSLQTSSAPSVSSSKSSATPSQTSVKSPASSTAKVTNNMDDEDDTTIIIAVVVSIVAVLAVAVIFGVVLWRRKKKAKAKAARYHTRTNASLNGNVGHSERSNGRGASNATDLNNYSLATISQDGNSPGKVDPVSDPYAKVDLEKKYAARRSAVETTNNEEPQYFEYNHHQNYTDMGPPVSLYDSSYNTASGKLLEDSSSPKFGQNGKTSGNVSNDVSYSDIAINNTGSDRPSQNVYSESDDRPYNDKDDEDDEIVTYRTSGVGGPSRGENPRCETSESSNDPQYSLARDITPDTGNVYSKLHDPVRNIANPYNDLMPDDDSVNSNTNTQPGSEYSRLHDQVKNVSNPYDVLTTNDDLINNRSSV